YLLSGEEQQGKTSILKRLCSKLISDDLIPIYLDAKDIKQSDISVALNNSVKAQYLKKDFTWLKENKKAVILLDNIDEISLNTKHAGKFIKSLNENFDFIVMTCHSSFSYVQGDVEGLHDYVHGEILALGNKKREEIVKKWIALGQEETIDDVS